jgi:hypothetical protein
MGVHCRFNLSLAVFCSRGKFHHLKRVLRISSEYGYFCFAPDDILGEPLQIIEAGSRILQVQPFRNLERSVDAVVLADAELATASRNRHDCS